MTTRTLKDIAVNILMEIVAGDIRGAYERHVGDGCRHHNPYDARASLTKVEEQRRWQQEEQSWQQP